MAIVCAIMELAREPGTNPIVVGEPGVVYVDYGNAAWARYAAAMMGRQGRTYDNSYYDVGAPIASPTGSRLNLPPLYRVVSLDTARGQPVIMEQYCYAHKNGLIPYQYKHFWPAPGMSGFVSVFHNTNHRNLGIIHRVQQGLPETYELIDPRRQMLSTLKYDARVNDLDLSFDVHDRLDQIARKLNDSRLAEFLARNSYHANGVQQDFITIARSLWQYDRGSRFGIEEELVDEALWAIAPKMPALDPHLLHTPTGVVAFSDIVRYRDSWSPMDLYTGVVPIKIRDETEIHPPGYTAVIDHLAQSAITDAIVSYISLNGTIVPHQATYHQWHSRYGSLLTIPDTSEASYRIAAQTFLDITVDKAKHANDNHYLSMVLNGVIVRIQKSYTEEILLEVIDSRDEKTVLRSVYLDVAAAGLAPSSVTAI